MSKVVDEVLQSGKYHVYPEYKDSGVDWLGNIPFHWEKSRIGFEASIKARLGWKGLKADEYVEDGYIFLATPNIKGSEIDFNNVNYITKFRYDESPEIKINVGDVLVTKDGSTTGTCNIVRKLPSPATVNSSIAVIRPIRNLVSEYLYYFFLSPYTQSVIKLMQGGMGVPHLFQADLCEFNILLPPMNEQRTIAAFLDYETARIDRLIAQQQRLIELLKEKRQAVISHAVTKGLNPDAPMKDSGIEWLGQVPKHWVVSPLKYKCEFSGGGTPSKDNLEYWNGSIPWVSPKDMKSFWITDAEDKITEQAIKESSTKLVQPGAVLMVVRSGILQRTIPVGINTIPVTMNQDMKAIRFSSAVYAEWLSFFIKGYEDSLLLDWRKQGATVESIEHEFLANSLMPFPPEEEARSIIAALGRRLDKFDQLEQRASDAITLLQERRTALISAAVTGKIDLRGWTPPAEEAAA